LSWRCHGVGRSGLPGRAARFNKALSSGAGTRKRSRLPQRAGKRFYFPGQGRAINRGNGSAWTGHKAQPRTMGIEKQVFFLV